VIIKNEPELDELLDFVDEQDNVIGQKKRSEIYSINSHNFRAINVFIINEEGKIWIPRRVATKKLFPLCLDMSVGGHVKSGETYEQALKRETKEEVDLEIDKIKYRALGHLSPYKHNVAAFQTIYEIKYNQTPNYNKNDFCEYYWYHPLELLEKIKNGEKVKNDLPKLVKFFIQQLQKSN